MNFVLRTFPDGKSNSFKCEGIHFQKNYAFSCFGNSCGFS